jgi:hypothetical protein
LQVKTFAIDKPDQLRSISAKYENTIEETEEASDQAKCLGRIRVDWLINDDSDVSQFNLIWLSVQESLTMRKSLDSSSRSCYLPVTRWRCIYEICLETVYKSASKPTATSEKLFIEVPGSPDPPVLWLLEQKASDISIHWSEPRTYPNVPVVGYQV